MPAPQPLASVPPDASILLIRPDHLGDLLLAAPAIGLLRRGVPGARLSYMVGPWAEEVARRGPSVDEVLTCPFPGFTRQPKPSPLHPYALLLARAARLRGRFHAALVLRPDHWWGALLARAAGIPLRLGFSVPECASFLTHSLPWPAKLEVGGWKLELDAASLSHLRERAGVREASNLPPPSSNLQLASIALVRRLLALVPSADPQVAPEPERFTIFEHERAFATALLTERGIVPERPLVVVHPGSGARLKHWPAESWAEVARALMQDCGAQVLVTGAQDEQPLVERLTARLGFSQANLAGRTTLGQLAAVLERAQLALGPDNGPMHLAAAVGTPSVRIFGPTDPDLFMPVGLPDQHALTIPLPCRPCRVLESPPCGATVDPACVAGISVDQVVGVASSMLHQVDADKRGRGHAKKPPASATRRRPVTGKTLLAPPPPGVPTIGSDS